MELDKQDRGGLRQGAVAAIPIMIGYFPIAIAFGLLAKNSLISFRDTSFLSIFVYAGASQFMALDLLGTGAASASIILATFLLNLRHMIMSASLAVDLGDLSGRLLALIGFGITDETFSVISFNREKISPAYLLTINFMSYGSWVTGTMVGFFFGEALPASLQASLGIGLYAMFAGLLTPEIGKSKKILHLSIISALVYMLLFYSNIFAAGWDIIIGIIISSGLGVLFLGDKGRERP